jgi:hypothetical protein
MKKHFTLFVNPPMKESKKTDLKVLGKDYDAYLDIIFDGSCIPWSNHKRFFAMSGKLLQDSMPIIRVLGIQESRNWILVHNSLVTVFDVASGTISRDAKMVAFGA